MKTPNLLLPLFILYYVLCTCNCDTAGLNLKDLLAAANNNQNSNNEQNAAQTPAAGFSTTSVKTQEFSDLPSLIAAMKGGGGDNTANLDISSLLKAKQANQQQQPQQQSIELAGNNVEASNNDKSSNALNLAKLAALLGKQTQGSEGLDVAKLASNAPEVNNNANNADNAAAAFLASHQKDKAETEPSGLKIETDGDNSQSGHSHFSLQRSPDGGLMLVPVKEQTGASRGLDIGDLAKKPANEVGGTSRQQLQLTTLVSGFRNL